MTHFPTLSYTTASEVSTFLYLKPTRERYPFRLEPPHKGRYVEYPRDRNRHMWSPEWTLLSNAHSSLCTKTRLPLHDSSKIWMSSFSSGRFAVYNIKLYKNTTDNKLRKNFCWLKNFVYVEPIWFSLDNVTLCGRPNYSSMVFHAIKENFRCTEAFLLRTARFFYCFPQR